MCSCVALGPAPNVELVSFAQTERGSPPVLKSEQGCARYKGKGMFGDVGCYVAL